MAGLRTPFARRRPAESLRVVRWAALAYAIVSAGCSAPEYKLPVNQVDDVGELGLQLELASGSNLDTVSYVVTGPSAFQRSGSISVPSSARISTTVGGLPAGSGYTIEISASSDGGTICAGSASFSVAARATTVVVLQIVCREPPGQGGVSVGGRIDFCPVIDTLTADVAEANVGRKIVLKGAAHDSDNGPSPISYRWESNAGFVMNMGGAMATFTCTQPGAATITLVASDGICIDTLSINVNCSVPTLPLVRINEVESSGGVPGDWVELYNGGTNNVDISRWVFRDNDDTHTYTIPAGTTIEPGGYFLLEEASIGFGLGAADTARLYDDTGIAVVDSYSWTMHATTTYGRCPSGTGNFTTTLTPTKGEPNACEAVDADAAADSGSGVNADASTAPDLGAPDAAADVVDEVPIPFDPWPGTNAVTTVDGANVFGANLSGLHYQPGTPSILWAVRNAPSTLYRIVFDGGLWAPMAANGWKNGKTIYFPNGMGSPDSEGVTKAEWDSSAVYVSTERDNDLNNTSHLSVLRFDADTPGATLTATHEWNLTGDLPPSGANLGLEAITWVPDTFLVGGEFVDESTGQLYDPGLYPNHGTGVFIVGLESNGFLYAYALDHVSGAFHRLASFSSGNISVMDIQFDRDVGYLWTVCDDTCANRSSVLRLDTNPSSRTHGKFYVVRIFDRPSTLPNINNEGFAIAPESECANNQKALFWTDDDQTGGHALRRDLIPCGPFLGSAVRY